jgi:hypothetical protein
MNNLKEHGNKNIVTALIGSKIDLSDKRVISRE